MRSEVVGPINYPLPWAVVVPLWADKDEDEDDAEDAKDDKDDDEEDDDEAVDEADDTEDAVTPTPVGDDWTGEEEEPLAEEKDEDEDEEDAGTGGWRGGSDPPWG